MRNLATAIATGIAAVAVAGFAATASAQSPKWHVMTVPLPGGGVEEIHYTGDVAPRVSVTTGPAALAALPAFFGPDSPFAAMQRISVEMDRAAAAMLREAATLAAQPWPAPGQVSEAALRAMPPGSHSYSFVSTMSGGHVCSRSMSVTVPADGGQPRVVTNSSGDCGPETGAAGGAVALPPAPAPNHGPDLLWTRNRPMPRGLVREADWRR